MDKNHIVDSYAALLQQELDCLVELNALLKSEHELLSKSQLTELESIAEKKQKWSDFLEISAQKRLSILKECTQNQTFAELVSGMPISVTTQLEQLSSSLAVQIEICREQNLINGQIISNNLYARQEIVNILSNNQAAQTAVYNANGDVENTTKTKHHQEA